MMISLFYQDGLSNDNQELRAYTAMDCIDVLPQSKIDGILRFMTVMLRKTNMAHTPLLATNDIKNGDAATQLLFKACASYYLA